MTTPTAILVQDAPPADPPPTSGGMFGDGFGSFVPLLLIFAIFYFVMIRPEGKRRREREAMLETLKKGDRVMTSGGMYGTVASVQDDVVSVQVSDGVRVRFSRSAIQTIVDEKAAAEPAKA